MSALWTFLRCLRYERSWWVERSGETNWTWTMRDRCARVVARSACDWPTRERAVFAVEQLKERIAEATIEVVDV